MPSTVIAMPLRVRCSLTHAPCPQSRQAKPSFGLLEIRQAAKFSGICTASNPCLADEVKSSSQWRKFVSSASQSVRQNSRAKIAEANFQACERVNLVPREPLSVCIGGSGSTVLSCTVWFIFKLLSVLNSSCSRLVRCCGAIEW